MGIPNGAAPTVLLSITFNKRRSQMTVVFGLYLNDCCYAFGELTPELMHDVSSDWVGVKQVMRDAYAEMSRGTLGGYRRHAIQRSELLKFGAYATHNNDVCQLDRLLHMLYEWSLHLDTARATIVFRPVSDSEKDFN